MGPGAPDTGGSPRLRGILPPLVTPFGPGGALDLTAFEANLEAYAAHDLDGYLVLGSNGEAPCLDPSEKLALVTAARRGAASRRLLVGAGLESTEATVSLCRQVADLGADGVLVLTPHYYRAQMTVPLLRQHYERVADASPVPVYLYTVPAFTGIPCPPELPGLLAAHPNVAGIKESSGDLALLGRILATTPERFTVVCGSAPVFYPALCLGASGGILAVACCAPRLVAALYRAAQAGQHEEARRLQAALSPLALAVTGRHGVAGLKAAITLAGYRGGEVRPPLRPVDSQAREELQALLARATEAVGS
jgi:4-hydroxy-2-oxoglutarate aldolase